MTQSELTYIKKLKAFNNYLLKYSGSSLRIDNLKREIAELEKQIQFEMLCDPDIYEVSANEHFEREEKKLTELISISARLIEEIVDNYEADAINLPIEMYNELKFHWIQLNKNH